MTTQQWRRPDGQLDVEALRPYIYEHGSLPPEIESGLVDRTEHVQAVAARLRGER